MGCIQAGLIKCTDNFSFSNQQKSLLTEPKETFDTYFISPSHNHLKKISSLQNPKARIDNLSIISISESHKKNSLPSLSILDFMKIKKLYLTFIKDSEIYKRILICQNILTKLSNQGALTSPSHFNNKRIEKKYSDEIEFSFGKISQEKEKKKKLVDCELDDAYMSKHQFNIVYNMIEKEYYLDEVKEGSGVFQKIIKKRVIPSTTSTFFFGGICCEITYKKANRELISVEFINGDFQNRIFNLNAAEKKIYTLGHLTTTDFPIVKEGISKIHWTLGYNDENWVLYDGLFSPDTMEQRESTNGIWELIKNRLLLEDGLKLKTPSLFIDVCIQSKGDK